MAKQSKISPSDHYCHVATQTKSYRSRSAAPGASAARGAAPELASIGAVPKVADDVPGKAVAAVAAGALWMKMMEEISLEQGTSLHDFSAQIDPACPGVVELKAKLPSRAAGTADMSFELAIFDSRQPFASIVQWALLRIVGHEEFARLQVDRALAMCAAEEPVALEKLGLPFPVRWGVYEERRQLLEDPGQGESRPKAPSQRL